MRNSDNDERFKNNPIPSPKNQSQWLKEAKFHYKAKRYDKALAACEQALELDPTSAIAHKGKGAALFCMGRYFQALPAFIQALELDPKDAGNCINKGHVLYALNRYTEALTAYEQALKLDPNNTIADKGKMLVIKRESEVLETQVQTLLLLEHKDQVIDPSKSVFHPYNLYSLYGGVAVKWSSSGVYIAYVLPNQTIRVCEVTSKKPILTYSDHDRIIDNPSKLAWSPGGTHIASGGNFGSVHVWNASSGNCDLIFKGHRNRVLTIEWSPDGRYIVSGSSANDYAPPYETVHDKLHIWEAATGKIIYTYCGHISQGKNDTYIDGVYIAAWSPDGKWIASVGSGSIKVWEVTSGKACCNYDGHPHGTGKLAWSPNGKYIASTGHDNTIHIWDASTANRILSYAGNIHGVSALAWSPDGSHIVSGDGHNLQVWEVSSGKLVYTYRGHSDGILRMPSRKLCNDITVRRLRSMAKLPKGVAFYYTTVGIVSHHLVWYPSTARRNTPGCFYGNGGEKQMARAYLLSGGIIALLLILIVVALAVLKVRHVQRRKALEQIAARYHQSGRALILYVMLNQQCSEEIAYQRLAAFVKKHVPSHNQSDIDRMLVQDRQSLLASARNLVAHDPNELDKI